MKITISTVITTLFVAFSLVGPHAVARELGYESLDLRLQERAVTASTPAKKPSFVSFSRYVNCDRGQSLGRALKFAWPGSQIVVRGTCREQVQVKKDGIHIMGRDGAVIDGAGDESRFEGTLTIHGARNVHISGLTIQNGTDQGVVVAAGSSAVLSDLVLSGHKTTGLSVDASYVELSNIESWGNVSGADFFTGSTVIAKGPLSVHNNAGPGLAVNLNSVLELRGSVIDTYENGADGITLVNDSDLVILSFPESQGSGIRSRANGAVGLFVANSSLAIVGSSFAGSGANVISVSEHLGQEQVGMLFIESNLSAPFATARFDVSANATGIVFTDNSSAFVNGGLNVSSNGAGIVGDGAGVLRLKSDAKNPSTVDANFGPDLIMQFGTRFDLGAAVAHSTLVCDPTVLTPAPESGSVQCPVF